MSGGEPDWAMGQIGRVLGSRWTLERALGSGGTAVVFEAMHRNGKRVAVKVLKPERSLDPAIRRRFVSEGYAANRVGHPAVVGVDDDGEEPDGTVYLVMELLIGESLDRLAQRLGGCLPWRLTAEITLELLEVLATAHRRGITHRDIKPANLWWSHTGTLRVLDFGLARFAEAPPDHLSTGEGALLGTPAFMAPEQARAAANAVGPLSDLWSVGATAFFLLTGRRVYEAPTLDEQLALAAACPAPSLSKLVPEVPGPVARVFQRALAHEPRERWPDANAMREALAAALRETGPGPRAVGTASDESSLLTTVPERAPPRRSPAIHRVVVPGVGLGLALALGGVVLAMKREASVPPPAEASAAPPAHVELREPVPVTSSSAAPAALSAAFSATPPPFAAPSARGGRAKAPRERGAVAGSGSPARPGPAPALSGIKGMIEEPPF
jgi:serine/threonine-protein kinase